MNSDKTKIDNRKIVDHWAATSDDDYETMIGLYVSKNYNWSLFIGHFECKVR